MEVFGLMKEKSVEKACKGQGQSRGFDPADKRQSRKLSLFVRRDKVEKSSRLSHRDKVEKSSRLTLGTKTYYL